MRSERLLLLLLTVAVACAQAMRVRRELRELSAAETDDLVRGYLLLKEEGSYDKYVAAHVHCILTPTAFEWETGAEDQCSEEEAECVYRNACHRGPAFLPWHRFLLLRLELEFQRVLKNESFAFPYWDWTLDDEQGLQYPYWTTFMGGDGDSAQDDMVVDGPFAYSTGNWNISLDMDGPYLRRQLGRMTLDDCPGMTFNSTPTAEHVDFVFESTVYNYMPFNSELTNDGFQNRLEGWIPPFHQLNRYERVRDKRHHRMPYCGDRGPHNQVHLYIGGSMSASSTGPNEPAFFLHHSFIDKLWYMWTAKQASAREDKYADVPIFEPFYGGPPAHNFFDQLIVDEDLIPYDMRPTIADMYDISDLGYAYSDYGYPS